VRAGETLSVTAARRAAERHLAESVDTDPGTSPSVLLDRAARCRAVLAGLLAAMTEPEQPRMPLELAPFAERWTIAFDLAWTADRRVGSSLRVVADHDPKALARKLGEIEAAETDPARSRP
jgi:hypothetical protein